MHRIERNIYVIMCLLGPSKFILFICKCELTLIRFVVKIQNLPSQNHRYNCSFRNLKLINDLIRPSVIMAQTTGDIYHLSLKTRNV